MKIFVFAGAGSSIELGVPAMHGMALEFLSHCQHWDIEYELVKQILEPKLDIEELIEVLDQLSTAGPSLPLIDCGESNLDAIKKIRAEVEWFVQHAAERINPIEANILWGESLNILKSHELSLATTNYDRAIELSANFQKIILDDGFGDFGASEISEWVGFNDTPAEPKLIKIHGSTDWYSNVTNNSPLKLRHPMPLFGDAKLVLKNGENLGSALILPSREKLLSKLPYTRMTQSFLNSSDNCEMAIFIGSSLRDQHIKDAVETMSKQKPVFVVDPNDLNIELPNVFQIRQNASLFLISTLPNALLSGDPINLLKLSANLQNLFKENLLNYVKIITDHNSKESQICELLEDIDKNTIPLTPNIIKKLLTNTSVTVGKYALGLIPLSPKKNELIKFAEKQSHFENLDYKNDLELLKTM